MHKIKFATNAKDKAVIEKIMQRAAAMREQRGMKVDRLSLLMDITACHLNGTPLKLAELLAADDFNLAHDVFGIERHMNRETGKLEGFFMPRFASHEAEVEKAA